MSSLLTGLVMILVLGVGSEWLAWRLGLPSILVLLLSGFLVGPIFHWLSPDELFGRLLFPVVSLSVAILLFEGGLSLRISDLKRFGGVLWNLVTVGILISWILTALAAMVFLNMDFSLSLLLGAILVVTGPTVIVPMLRQLRLSSHVGGVLKWEAMVNDPIGAVLAVLVFEAIFAGGIREATHQAMTGLLGAAFWGVVTGTIGALCLRIFLQRHIIPDFLQSPVTLAMVALVLVTSNFFQAESGLLAVTLMGILLANQKGISLQHILEFKENLRVLIISGLFLILSARLELRYFTLIGISGIGFILFLILVVRPMAVFCSTWKSPLNVREKIFLSWMAPRGIVAAAVGSILSLELARTGYPNAERIVAVIFFVIIITVVLYGFSGRWVARFLGVAQPNPQGFLILGAQPWAQKLALALKAEGFPVLLVDRNWFHVQNAQRAGLLAVQGDILSEQLADALDLEGIGRFLALTANDEVNSLAALHFARYFGNSEVYQIPNPRHEKGPTDAIAPRLHGRYLFSERATYEALSRWFQQGEICKVHFSKDYDYKTFQNQYQERVLPLFLITETNQLRIITSERVPVPKAGQAFLAILPRSEQAD